LSELKRHQREQLEREETIISKAEELFCIYGFEKTSMDELAKVSEYTKRTIYRYFTCKEDLYFAVALKAYKQLWDMIKTASQNGATGFEKIRLSYYAYYEFFCKFPQLLKIINMSSVIKSSLTDIEVPYRQKLMDFDKLLFGSLTQMFFDGKSDGSIRSDLEVSQLAFSSIFMAAGFFQMLSLSGNTYTNHFGLDKEAFIKFTIEMLIDSLRKK
jgi:AcrR family transcriptional regulator